MNKVLIYTVHKAASMFLHRITSEIAAELEIDYYSINDNAYHDAIHRESWRTFIDNDNRVGCFGPIRAGTAEPAIPEQLASYRVVLHLRDPRDVLTSLFFSHTYSHVREAGRFNPSDEQQDQWKEEGIDAFVLQRAPEFLRRYQLFCDNLLDQDNVVFVTYEEMIGDFPKWLEKFLSAFSNVPPPRKKWFKLVPYPNTINRIHRRLCRLQKTEFFVPDENFEQHKRQISPGDHLRKLSPPTIERLNEQFYTVLTRLGYDV